MYNTNKYNTNKYNMVEYKLSLNLLEEFGKVVKRKTIDKTIFNGLNLFTNNNQSIKECKKLCINILEGNVININYLYVENLLLNLVNNNYKEISNILIDVFNYTTNNLSLYIQNKLDENSLMLHEYIDKYDKYYKNTIQLKNIFKYYEDCIYHNNNSSSSTTSSYILKIRNISLYLNTYNKKYNYKGKQIYIHEYFSNDLNKFLDDNNIHYLIKYYKMSNFYKYYFNYYNLSNDTINKYFNNNINIKIKNCQEKIIQKVLIHINNKIINLQEKNTKKEIKDSLNTIQDMLKMSIVIFDKGIFLILYQKYLIDRLVTHKIMPEVELEIIKMFLNHKKDYEYYIRFMYQISDAIMNKQHNNIFKNIQVNIITDEFKNFNIHKLKREECKFFIMRKDVWNYNINDLTSYNLPKELDIYITIFKKYYQDRYENKKIIFQNDNSNGVLKMKLYDNKEYLIEMNFLQMSTIINICKFKNISASELSNKLNIKLNYLEHILNSLLYYKLIKRDEGLEDNPNLNFMINWDCKFTMDKISIIKTYNDFKDNKIDKTVKENKININVLRAKIIGLLKLKNYTFDKLLLKLKTELQDDITAEILEKELQLSIKNKRIIKDNDLYMYDKFNNEMVLIDDDISDISDDDYLSEISDSIDNITKNKKEKIKIDF
jgi:hypothetical protein